MRRIRTINRRSVARDACVAVTALVLSAAAAAAQTPRGTAHGAIASHKGAHHHRGGQVWGATGGPLINQAPVAPPPTFNQSGGYTVPQAPETPVSPASPGSVFGNGR